LISRLLDKREEGAVFSDSELVDNCMLLFADGIGNVDSGLANLLAVLLQNPQQLAQLYHKPELIPQAVDEGLRLESPGQFISRIATEDMQWQGQQIKQYQAIFLLLGSANHDEAVFAEPEVFDLQRDNLNESLSFGRSSHSCVGAHLVRLEMQAALRMLLAHFSEISLRQKQLHWRRRRAHRWLESLPLSVERF